MRIVVRAGASLLAVALLAVPFAPAVRAECTMLDKWPAFRKIAPVAELVVLGTVVEDRDPNSELLLKKFGLRIDHVFRGAAVEDSVLEIAYLTPGPPPVQCADTYIRPLLGEVLAIAFNAPGPDGESLNSAAWIKGEPDDMQRGLGKITRGELRSLFDLPSTDIARPPPTPDWTPPWGPLVLVGLLGAALLLRRIPASS